MQREYPLSKSSLIKTERGKGLALYIFSYPLIIIIIAVVVVFFVIVIIVVY